MDVSKELAYQDTQASSNRHRKPSPSKVLNPLPKMQVSKAMGLLLRQMQWL
jgi:hypothetical protein